MSSTVSASARNLRVALVFGGTLQSEETLQAPRNIVLGYGPGALLPLPEGVLPNDHHVVMRPIGATYDVLLHPSMGGSVWLGGQRREVRELLATGQPVRLGPDDYGVITLGRVAFFFQMVAATPVRPGTSPFMLLNGSSVAAYSLSGFVHLALGALFMLAQAEAPPGDDLELPTDLIRRFMVTPPPEDLLEPEPEQAGGTETEDPGIRDREEAGGQAAEEPEGRVGREDAEQEETEMEGEVTGGAAERVRNMGLIGAIRGSDGQESALSEALQGPSIDNLLGGLNSGRTVMGRGSGGVGLRGGGSGGGGSGPGTLFGAGRMGTGVGAGRGAGGGRGRGGPGARGRRRAEVSVRVQMQRPNVSGYLSPEQIMRVVRRHQGAVQHCYDAQLQRQPNLRGRISVRWRIARDGRVSSARIASTTMRNSRVEGCIVRQVRRWRFPQPDGGEVDVNFPFNFAGGG